MSNVSIGVMWYPRKQEAFEKMEQSIGEPFTVYPDFDTFKFKTKQPVKFLGGNVGCFKHYYRVLEDLCNSESEYVAVFSDDVIYFNGWLERALQGFTDGVGYVACYVPNELAKRHEMVQGWNEIKGGWNDIYGGGFVFKREIAKELLQHPFILNHLENYEANQQIDLAIPESVFQMGLKQMFHIPSLMNHIGHSSTIGHKHTHDNVGAGW